MEDVTMSTEIDPRIVRKVAEAAFRSAICVGSVGRDDHVEAALIASGVAGPVLGEKFDAYSKAVCAEYDRLAAARTVASPAPLVAEFHAAFDLPRADRPVLILDTKISGARQRLLEEEVAEVAAAKAWDNLPGIAQELADVVYVAYGTALTYGIDLDAVLAEVHRANMAKLGPDGRPTVVDGKVVKPEGWQKPNVAGVLAALGACDANETGA